MRYLCLKIHDVIRGSISSLGSSYDYGCRILFAIIRHQQHWTVTVQKWCCLGGQELMEQWSALHFFCFLFYKKRKQNEKKLIVNIQTVLNIQFKILPNYLLQWNSWKSASFNLPITEQLVWSFAVGNDLMKIRKENKNQRSLDVSFHWHLILLKKVSLEFMDQ